MDRTTLGPPAPMTNAAKSGVESNGDSRHSPAGGNENLLEVFSCARSYFEARGLNHMDAQDLAMESCLRWLAQLQLRHEPLACAAWLRRVAGNLLIDHFRRRGREQLLLESYAGELRTAAEENHRPNEWWAETLAELPPADRDLLLGHYVEGFKVRELARRLELSADCVKQRLHRARQRLQDRLCETPARPVRRAP